MSSDNELDEDELLQMALKEQSQRDLNYRRPSSANNRKPAANNARTHRRKSLFLRYPSPTEEEEQRRELWWTMTTMIRG
ncbi:hypothetical protein F8388_027036 [Cannabis sativa]|uniref:Uncharacterized protein n=1 Tax=Cannabis sativa TaxID=3483 RepID=A0A7J6FNR4_CANSA|nr:hypothetical protein F8388_027036 [Cannabis sativa]